MSVLFLTEAEVDELIDMPTAIEVVEEAFRQLAAGEAHNVPRHRALGPGIVLHTMSAAAAYLNLVGWKSYTTTRHGATFHVGLYDLETGAPVALIEANRLGQLRTGATTGVATSWLAATDAGEMGLFGAGYQAETQLEAVVNVRPVRRAFVYSRNPQKRMAFCEKMAARLAIEVTPVDRPQEAAEDLPIVVTATTSREPVFDGNDLTEGALVCAMGSNWASRAEIDSTVVRRADHVVCDSVECCQLEAGDFADAIERGIFDWNRAVDLANVVADRAVGRSHQGRTTLFKSVGMAIEDVALAARVIERAGQRGVGVKLTR